MDELTKVYMELDLKSIKKYAEEVAGSWNGDEAGRGEERADCAKEIIENVDRLLELLEELDN